MRSFVEIMGAVVILVGLAFLAWPLAVVWVGVLLMAGAQL